MARIPLPSWRRVRAPGMGRGAGHGGSACMHRCGSKPRGAHQHVAHCCYIAAAVVSCTVRSLKPVSELP